MPDADGATSHEVPGSPAKTSRRLSVGSGLTLALAVTRWHAEITDSLLERAAAAGEEKT